MAGHTPRRFSGRRISALTAGLLAALVLVAANAGRAAAAPPEVVASENPVVVPLNQSTKNITLSWNLGNAAPKATLKVTDNAEVVVLNQPVAAQTGSTPLTVTHGKSYTAQLYTVANPPVTLGSPLTITTVHPPGDPNSVCSADLCINSVAFTPHGTYAPFTVKTNKAAHFEMQASTSAPLADGSFTHVDSATFNLSNVTQWDSKLLNLTPDTTYHYTVKATSASGQVVKKSGTFKTLRRRVEVTLTSIHMIEDSDILSACDCYFYLQAGNAEPAGTSFMYVNSGDTVNLALQTVVFPEQDTLRIRVEADDDDYEFFDFCAGAYPPFWGNGSTACYDWSSVTKFVDVSLSGMEDSKFDTYTLTANQGPVKFTATVKVKVDYAP
jgi:hypothetical protein